LQKKKKNKSLGFCEKFEYYFLGKWIIYNKWINRIFITLNQGGCRKYFKYEVLQTIIHQVIISDMFK
jgi:hypothetical protein